MIKTHDKDKLIELSAVHKVSLIVFITLAMPGILLRDVQAQSQRNVAQSGPPQTTAPSASLITVPPNDWEDLMISTDRNSFTPHPNVVPRGVLQAENGLTLEKFAHGGSFNVPETSLRLGLLKWTELRFGVPNYFHATGTENVEGTTDISVGIKQEIDPPMFKKRGFDFGIIGGMTLPTGTRNLTTKRVDPFVQTVAFQKIGQNWIVGSAHSIFSPSVPTSADVALVGSRRRHNIIYQPTVIVYRAFGPRLDLWTEYAANFARQGNSEQYIDFGILWRPKNRHQFDLRAGAGLTTPTPRAFIGVGYSFILARLWNRK